VDEVTFLQLCESQ